MERRVALSWIAIAVFSILAAVPIIAAGPPYGRFDWMAYEPVYGPPPPAMPDLVLSKSVSPPTVQPGALVTYTIHYRNAVTETAATNVRLTDTLPLGVAFHSATPAPTSLAGGIAVWNIGTLGGGAEGTIRLAGLVSTTVVSGTVLHNTAAVTMQEADANPGDEVAVAEATVVGSATPIDDRVPPVVTIISPRPGVVWFTNLRYAIKWRAADLESGVPTTDSIRIRYSLDDGATWTSIVDSAQAAGKASCDPGGDCSGGVAAQGGDDLLDNTGCAPNEGCIGRATWDSARMAIDIPVAIVGIIVLEARDRSGNWGSDRVAFRIQDRTPGAVRDVQVSNVTDIAASLAARTELDRLAGVQYRERDAASGPALTADDFRGSVPGQTHFFRLGGSSATDRLKPSTVYTYGIHLDESVDPVYSGSFTTGPTLDLRSIQGAFGRVYDPFGNPAPGSLVNIWIENRSDTINSTVPITYGQWLPITRGQSSLMSAVTDENGYWWANLAEARTLDLTAPLAYSPTDIVHLTAWGGGGPLGSFAYGDPPVSHAWPFDLYLRPQSSRTLTFGVGWNAVSLPITPTRPLFVSQLAEIFNGDGVTRLTDVLRYSSGRWEGVVFTRTTVLGENNFALTAGEGYFYKIAEPNIAQPEPLVVWELSGYDFTFPVSVPVETGWNLIGVPSADLPGVTWRAADISDGLGRITNTMVITDPTTYNVAEVDRFIYGGFEGHVSGYPFNNFPLAADQAYFVRTNRPGIMSFAADQEALAYMSPPDPSSY
ncbi:MAG: DUF11 domain-containing protein [Chloroflexi bacterium]|nr:DUF11 domain-containing protein [Chloroflexota bacterium]